MISSLGRQVTLNEAIRDLEQQIDGLFKTRHDYPIWPFGQGPYDEYDKMICDPVRAIYYDNTIYLIHLLKTLKAVAR